MAGSPDQSRYTSMTLYDRDPYGLVSRALVDAGAKLPGWTPRVGALEFVMIEALAQIVSEEIYAINRVPDGIAEVLIGNFGIARGQGAPPKATVTFKLADNLGHEIPAGTVIRLPQAGLDPIDFATDVAVVVPVGSNSVTASVTGTTNTVNANGVPANSILSVVTPVAYVDLVTLASVPSGGADPETAEEWRDRAITRLGRLTDSLVLPKHFSARALEAPEVGRAITRDNWNVDVGAVGHVTVAVADVGGNALTALAMAALQADMDAAAFGAISVHVAPPTYNAVTVTSNVVALSGYVVADVQQAAADALDDYLSPSSWSWNGVVRKNEIIALLDGVDGVDYVVDVSLNGGASDLVLTGAFPLVRSGTHSVAVVAATLPQSQSATPTTPATDTGSGTTIPDTSTGGGTTTTPSTGTTTGGGTTPVGSAGGSTTAPAPSGGLTTQQKNDLLDTGLGWYAEFVRPDGCVLNKESTNPHGSVSEGVGYAMKKAVLLNRQDYYDRVVAYADKYMRRGSSTAATGKTTALNLLGWALNPNTNKLNDANFATDAEMDRFLAAWRAWKQWGRASDRALALAIANDIADFAVMEDEGKAYLVTDEWQKGRTNGQSFFVWEENISYQRPIAYPLMKALTGRTVFDRMTAGYNDILVKVTDNSGGIPTQAGLPPNWNDHNTGNHDVGALQSGVRGWTYSRSTGYSYDAFRTIPSAAAAAKKGNTVALAWLQGALKTTFTTFVTGRPFLPTELNHDGSIAGDYQNAMFGWAAYQALTAGDPTNAAAAAYRAAKLNAAPVSNSFGKYWATGDGQASAYYGGYWLWQYHAMDYGLYDDITSEAASTTFPFVAGTTTTTTTDSSGDNATFVNVPPSAVGSPTSVWKLTVDPNSANQAEVAKQPNATIKGKMQWAASKPQFFWDGPDWDGDHALLAQYLAVQDAQTNTVGQMVIYGIPNRDFAGGFSAGGAPNSQAYKDWVNGCLALIGSRRMIICLEPDSIPQSVGLSQTEQTARYDLMKWTIQRIVALCPNARVYLDAGHSQWLNADQMAPLLLAAGVQYAHGISANVSNFRPDAEVRTFCMNILNKLGFANLGYIYDTGRNGGNAPDPADWANPPNRQYGLEPFYGPTAVDNNRCHGWGWIKRPGESDGTAHGGPAAGQWWAAYALDMQTRPPVPGSSYQS